MNRRDRRKKGGRPSDAARSSKRRSMTALPSEWAEIDALAARLAPMGYAANVSHALRACVRAVLNAEADGMATIEDGRVWIHPGPDRRDRP
jgi:negative regulator of sigma E activity